MSISHRLYHINNSSESINIAIYSMAYYADYPSDYSNILLQALVTAKNRGIDVKVLVDDYTKDDSSNSLGAIIYLQNKGIPIKLDQSNSVTTHSKIVIIDDTILLVGSLNWSYSRLQQNNEYSVVIKGNIQNAI